jgi:putative flippase GtrA
MRFLLYCLCGGTGVLTDYLVFHVGLTSGVWYQYANGLGYLSGTLVSFFLNRIFTFGVLDHLLKRLVMFIAVASIGFGASVALLWVLVDVVIVDARLAKLLTLPVVVVIQFSLNRFITFKTPDKA